MSTKKSVAVFTGSAFLAALAAYSVVQAQYYTNFEIPTSTCAQANCANCRQGKLNSCPICMNPADPNYIDANHPAVCFAVQNTDPTVVGAWCVTAGSNTQGCIPLTVTNDNPKACGDVLVWHCFPCLTKAADCMKNPCPCTPGGQDKKFSPINLGNMQTTCTDFTIATK